MQHALNYLKSPKKNMKTFFTAFLMGMLVSFKEQYCYGKNSLQKNAVDINIPGIHYFSENTKRIIIGSRKLTNEKGELLAYTLSFNEFINII